METGLPDGDRTMSPVATSEDDAVLTVEDDFATVYDAPFITVNRIEGQYQAEVITSGDRETDLERIQTALDVGTVHGVHPYARVHGEYGNILIFFSPDVAE